MRLIDADKFLEDNKELAECYFIHPKYCDTLRDLIDRTPTVCDIDAIRAEISDLKPYAMYTDGMVKKSEILQIIDRHMKGDKE